MPIWATSMLFTSINLTKPRDNHWFFCEKTSSVLFFWKKYSKTFFFASFSWKLVKVWNFEDYSGFHPKQHLCNHMQHSICRALGTYNSKKSTYYRKRINVTQGTPFRESAIIGLSQKLQKGPKIWYFLTKLFWPTVKKIVPGIAKNF